MSEPKTPDEFKGAYFQARKCAADLIAGCARLQTERDELRKALADRDALQVRVTALESIANSDDGAGGEGMKLYIENRDMNSRLAALEAQEPVDAIAVDDMSDGYDKRYGRVLVATENCIKPLYAAAGAAPNAWKEAILEVMTIYGMDAPTTDAPEKIIKDLIELATRVAIDPTLVAGAAPVPEGWRSAVAMAYGHLWHVNNEPMAPTPLRSEESASYAARKLLRDLLTTEERGEAINSVRAMLTASPKEQS